MLTGWTHDGAQNRNMLLAFIGSPSDACLKIQPESVGFQHAMCIF